MVDKINFLLRKCTINVTFLCTFINLRPFQVLNDNVKKTFRYVKCTVKGDTFLKYFLLKWQGGLVAPPCENHFDPLYNDICMYVCMYIRIFSTVAVFHLSTIFSIHLCPTIPLLLVLFFLHDLIYFVSIGPSWSSSHSSSYRAPFCCICYPAIGICSSIRTKLVFSSPM